MLRGKFTAVVLATGIALFSWTLSPTPAMAENDLLISTQELLLKLDSPDVVIVDVRVPGHWQKSATKILGAERYTTGSVRSWGMVLPKDKEIVLY
jgi:hypothetical protein